MADAHLKSSGPIGGRPILLVHGILDYGRRFGWMKKALAARGLGPVHAMSLKPNDGSIPFERMAAQVRGQVQELLQQNGVGQVDIVAFSMGALAARYYIHFLGGLEVVRRFISISGPHHGTWTAHLSANIACRQMRPGSELLEQMNTTGGWGRVRVHSFWTPLDLTIFPAGSSRLDGADNRTFVVPLHPLMITDRRVIAAVAKALTGD